jgi:very-short-patch-repair endonuclease
MNEIEQMFYDAFLKYLNTWRLNVGLVELTPHGLPYFHPQYRYKGYIMDFMYETSVNNEDNIKFCIEIDGHDFHTTKAQRLNDYQRERFLQSEGFHVVRFTASEVYVDAIACVDEFHRIVYRICKTYDKYADEMLDIDRQVKEYLRADKEGA